MNRPAVCLEASVIGYATSQASRDLLVAGHQQITRELFARRAQEYDLYIAQLVAAVASGGDEDAAQEREVFLRASGGSQ